VCVTPYAPFIMWSGWSQGNATLPGPVPLRTLNSAAVIQDGVYDPKSASFALTGFDIDYANLVFMDILQLKLRCAQRAARSAHAHTRAHTKPSHETSSHSHAYPHACALPARSYVVRQSYLELYLAVRDGSCDVGITAAELDWRRCTCDASCAAVPESGFDLGDADYTLGWTPALGSQDCCLEYGAPYYTSGFGLLSKRKARTMNVEAALTSPHFVNTALTILVMLLIAVWAVHGAEYAAGGDWGLGVSNANHGGVVNRAYPGLMHTVYWAITTMTTVGYGDVVASTPPARALTAIWSIASYMALSTLTSVVTTLLTANVLSSDEVNTLADVDGALCVEAAYPLLAEYVQRAQDAPTDVVYAPIADCIALLLAGDVRAVMAERPILMWYLSAYSLPALYMSPILHANPLSFVYANGSSLRSYANPAVIAASTNPLYVAQADSIASLYFGLPPRVAAMKAAPPPVTRSLVVAACVLSGVTLAAHAAQQAGALRWLAARPAVARALRWAARQTAGREARAKAAAEAAAAARCKADGARADAHAEATKLAAASRWLLSAAAEAHGTPEDGAGAAHAAAHAAHAAHATQAATRAAAAVSLLAELRSLSAAQASEARVTAERVDALQARVMSLLAVDAAAASAGVLPSRTPRALAGLHARSPSAAALAQAEGSVSGAEGDAAAPPRLAALTGVAAEEAQQQEARAAAGGDGDGAV
jgi:ABC-type amino acid transport substrate-binding protein